MPRYTFGTSQTNNPQSVVSGTQTSPNSPSPQFNESYIEDLNHLNQQIRKLKERPETSSMGVQSSPTPSTSSPTRERINNLTEENQNLRATVERFENEHAIALGDYVDNLFLQMQQMRQQMATREVEINENLQNAIRSRMRIALEAFGLSNIQEEALTIPDFLEYMRQMGLVQGPMIQEMLGMRLAMEAKVTDIADAGTVTTPTLSTSIGVSTSPLPSPDHMDTNYVEDMNNLNAQIRSLQEANNLLSTRDVALVKNIDALVARHEEAKKLITELHNELAQNHRFNPNNVNLENRIKELENEKNDMMVDEIKYIRELKQDIKKQKDEIKNLETSLSYATKNEHFWKTKHSKLKNQLENMSENSQKSNDKFTEKYDESVNEINRLKKEIEDYGVKINRLKMTNNLLETSLVEHSKRKSSSPTLTTPSPVNISPFNLPPTTETPSSPTPFNQNNYFQKPKNKGKAVVRGTRTPTPPRIAIPGPSREGARRVSTESEDIPLRRPARPNGEGRARVINSPSPRHQSPLNGDHDLANVLGESPTVVSSSTRPRVTPAIARLRRSRQSRAARNSAARNIYGGIGYGDDDIQFLGNTRKNRFNRATKKLKNTKHQQNSSQSSGSNYSAT